MFASQQVASLARISAKSLAFDATRGVALVGKRWLRLEKSFVQGPLDPPLSVKTLPQHFDSEVLGRFSAHPALICRTEGPRSHGGPPSKNLGVSTHIAWDFSEFDRHIDALARGLLGMGVEKGDRVGVIMGNNSAYAMLQWACARLGAILVTFNPAYRLSELVNTLNVVGVKHLFVVPRIRTSHYVRAFAEAFPEMRSAKPGELAIEEMPELRNLVVVDNREESFAELSKLHIRSTIDWREVLIWQQRVAESSTMQQITAGLDKDDVINLQFTSGTTGLPKAVSLTHSNLLNNALSIARCMRLTENDILCVLAEVEKRKAAGQLESVNMGSLRTGIAAGSPIPIDLMKNLISTLNLRDLTNAYGMTETSPVSFQTTPADPIIKRVETVGKVQPHVTAKIVNARGEIVDVGVPGEICVAGYLVQKGYWNDEEQTSAAMKRDENGTLWMHTGDEGIMDEEGYLRVVGRIKDIIIRGGENLFPVQIENAMTAHSAIREAAAVAVPDRKYGEVVGAWIVREPNTQISREEVRQCVFDTMNPQVRNAPSYVWFVGEDGTPAELPKTASGKVMKHILRDWSRELAGAGLGKVNT